MNKYNEKLNTLLRLILDDLGISRMLRGYTSEDFKRHQDMEECFDDFKNLCDGKESWDDVMSIEDLELSVRTTDLLVRGGIKTIRSLESASFEQICGLRNMDWKCAKEIYDKLIDEKFERSKNG